MFYPKEKENLRYLFLAFIPYFHNGKEKKMSVIFIGGMVITVKLMTKTHFIYTAGLVSEIKNPEFSANQELFPNLTMSTGKAGWTAFYLTLKQNTLLYLYTLACQFLPPL